MNLEPEFGPDEGINLMKGALVANGHRLYAEIWSDQPPVFTLTHAALHRRVGFDVAASRALVLAFVVLLVTALFSVVRRSEGRLAAWLAIGVLAASPLFQALSVTVAIGLPAIALMMAALDRAHAGALEGSRRNLWLAGILTALAAHTKLLHPDGGAGAARRLLVASRSPGRAGRTTPAVARPAGFWHDWFHEAVIAGFYNWLTRVLSIQIDLGIIDAASEKLAGIVTPSAAQWRRIETGYVRNYALSIFVGVVLILTYLALR